MAAFPPQNPPGLPQPAVPSLDLTGLCFRDQIFLNFVGGCLVPGNVFDYFANSPFYDRTCNNEQLRMQGIHPLDTAHLREMVGWEYSLHMAQEPHLFVLRKQKRDGPDRTTPVAAYYILDGSIYQAPSLHAVIGSRISPFTTTKRFAFTRLSRGLLLWPYVRSTLSFGNDATSQPCSHCLSFGNDAASHALASHLCCFFPPFLSFPSSPALYQFLCCYACTICHVLHFSFRHSTPLLFASKTLCISIQSQSPISCPVPPPPSSPYPLVPPPLPQCRALHHLRAAFSMTRVALDNPEAARPKEAERSDSEGASVDAPDTPAASEAKPTAADVREMARLDHVIMSVVRKLTPAPPPPDIALPALPQPVAAGEAATAEDKTGGAGTPAAGAASAGGGAASAAAPATGAGATTGAGKKAGTGKASTARKGGAAKARAGSGAKAGAAGKSGGAAAGANAGAGAGGGGGAAAVGGGTKTTKAVPKPTQEGEVRKAKKTRKV
ncbi:unnamed protein product [Closterium sp. NIES-54]